MARRNFLFVGLLLIMSMASLAVSDTGDHQQDDCSSQIMQMAPCITYVEGLDNNPTQACCASLLQVTSHAPKCLCQLLIMNGSISGGIDINRTLALQMPQLCQVPANTNISACPELLHISPNSPDAKIFQQNTSSPATGHHGVNFSPYPSPAHVASSSFQKTNLGLQLEANMALTVLALVAMLNIIIIV